jgi:multiple antibiotic resistance protein
MRGKFIIVSIFCEDMMDTLSAAVMLFLIMDPLGNLPIFTSVLKVIEPKRRRIILVRELLVALIILFIFLFSGQAILDFLNVGQETIRIAGGVILFLIG